MPFLIAGIYNFAKEKKDNNPELVFYSTTDDYDRADASAKLFVFEDLTPIKWLGSTHLGDEMQFVSAFTDVTGSVHHIILEVSRKDPLFDQLQGADKPGSEITGGVSLTGVFHRTSLPYTMPNYYGLFNDPDLSGEVLERAVVYEPGSKDYQTFLEERYKSMTRTAAIHIALGLAAIVLSVIITIRLRAPKSRAISNRQ